MPGNPLFDMIQAAKPVAKDPKKLRQAQKINALGQIINLVSQGAGGLSGATIKPTQDKVTPYLLNELNRQKAAEAATGDSYNKLLFNVLQSEQQNQAAEQRAADSRAHSDELQKKSFDHQDLVNKEFRLTPDQQMVTNVEKLNAQLGKEKDMADYNAGLREKAKVDESGNYPKGFKPVLMANNKYPLSNIELSTLYPNILSLMQNPGVVDRLKKLNSIYPIALKNLGLGKSTNLSPENWSAIISELWPELENDYKSTIKNHYGNKFFNYLYPDGVSNNPSEQVSPKNPGSNKPKANWKVSE